MTVTAKRMYTSPSPEEIEAFAERHLQPFSVVSGEIVAEKCPYCNGGNSGDTNTFYISLETGQYCCHRGKCAVRGGWVSLLRRFGEAAEIESVSKQFKPLDLKLLPATKAIYDYFKGRKISPATLTAFQISSDEEGNIVFPFYIEGDLIYVKYRSPFPDSNKPKEWSHKGAPPVLFGMDRCVPGEPLTIVEGQCDALACYEAGIRNVVSVPTGCENMAWIEPCWAWLENFDKIILFGDNDAPGQKMVKTLTNRLGEERIWTVTEYPDGCKDANDILCAYGKEALLQTYNSAQETPIQGLVDLADVEDVDPTTVPRIKTGIPGLDGKINGLETGGITIVTGNPGYGKSTLAGPILLNAIEQGHCVCAVSMELSSAKFREWALLQAAGSRYITTKWDPVKNCEVPVVYPPAVDRINEWWRGKFFLYESVDDPSRTVADSIISVFTMAAKRKGCDLFLVDNLMTALMDAGDDEYREQGLFMAKLKRFAIRYNSHVIVVAHPKKNKLGNITIGQDDVAGSKYVVNLASNVLVIEKPDIRVIKARDNGTLGLIECCYCPDSRRIYQADAGDKYNFSWDKTDLKPPKKKACDLPEYAIFSNKQMF